MRELVLCLLVDSEGGIFRMNWPLKKFALRDKFAVTNLISGGRQWWMNRWDAMAVGV